jgi:hypothetical protein
MQAVWKAEGCDILISNFRHVLYVVCFLLGNSTVSEIYTPTFRNTLFHPHRQVGRCRMTKFENCQFDKLDNSQIYSFYTYLPMQMEQTECSKTSAYEIQTDGELPRRKRTCAVLFDIRV